MRNRLVSAALLVYFGLSAVGSGLLVVRGILRAPIVAVPILTLIWEPALVGVLTIAAAIALWRRSATGWWLAVVLVATTIARRAPEFLLPWEGAPRPGLLIGLRVLFLLAAVLALLLLIAYRRDYGRNQTDHA